MKKILKSIFYALYDVFDFLYDLRFANFLERRERKRQRREDDIRYEGLPYRCRGCEVLGMCRRPKEQGWKCYHGCYLLEAKFEGLPRRCRSCEYLKECRKPKEQGWKCYHGCIIINQKRAEEQERSRQK